MMKTLQNTGLGIHSLCRGISMTSTDESPNKQRKIAHLHSMLSRVIIIAFSDQSAAMQKHEQAEVYRQPALGLVGQDERLQLAQDLSLQGYQNRAPENDLELYSHHWWSGDSFKIGAERIVGVRLHS